MSKWKIYSKTGVERAVVDSLQYNGTRMGERFLTVTVKSASPISFAVGDYIMYRNEKFEINYEPTLLKKAASGKYGEGFTYNDIKFNSLADELVRCDFCDIVLEEEGQEASQVHYTGLPDFGFFAETVDDLLDRIQANLDTIYPAPVDVAFFESLSPEDAITTYLSLGTPFTYNGLPVQMGTTVVSGTDILICKKPNGDFMMFQLVNYEPDWETNRRYHYTGNVSASDTSVAEYFANSDKIDTSSKHWVILSPDYERSIERGATYAEWNQYFVEGSEYTYGTTRQMVSVSSQKCWDALLLSYNTFKEPFIIHGRTIIVGSEGNVVLQNFKYGKGNGLYEIERNADSSQEIVSRLKAYGTTQNVPYKYYAMRYAMPFCTVDVNSIVTIQLFDLGFTSTFALITSDIVRQFPEVLTNTGYLFYDSRYVTIMHYAYAVKAAGSYAQSRLQTGYQPSDYDVLLFRRGDFGTWKDNLPGTNDDDWLISTRHWNMFVSVWSEEPSEAGKMYFFGGVNKYKCPYTAIVSPGGESMPTQMDVMNLMLPGFPDQSVYNWVKEHGATNTDDATGRATWNGKTAYFSKDRLRPYIDSLEVDNISIRPQSETFDGNNDKEEIYPTISEVTIGDLHDAGYDTTEKGWTDDEQRIDTVQMRSEYLVTDDGFVYESDEDGKQKKTKDATTGEIIDFKDTFFVDLPFLGFDLKKAIEDAGADCQLSVIDGKLGGREFTIKGVDDNMYERRGKYYWKVECERIQDTGIGLWFPYASYNFAMENTDHYVLLGINLPDSYVDAAATRLLKAALIFLDNNDETRYVIQPRIDELFMARNHDAVVAQREEDPSDDSKSIYEVIEEGTIFNIDDPDFGEYHLPIQQLTIKEYGNGSIPTFDVTLMEEPQTSSIQKQVDEAVNTAVREGGWTATGIKNMIASYGSNLFLSKNNNDTASGEIGFVKGLWIKTKGLFGFDADGNIKGNDIDATGDVTARSLKSTGSSGNTTADIDNSTQKNLGLEVAESGVIGGILRVAKNILTKTIQSLNFSGGDSLFGTGWQLTDDYGNGRSRLVVDDAVFRGKVVMNELEVRKLTAMGGNYVFSPAASIIEEVDYFGIDSTTGDPVLLGYEYVKVPWVLRLIPLSLLGRYLSRKKWVRSTMSDTDYQNVKFYRCWLKADDGSTQTINTWRVGMLARCQTFDASQIENGTHSDTYGEAGETWTGKDVTNKLYWRAVVNVVEGEYKGHYDKTTIALNDGRKHNYIDLSNQQGLFLSGSDNVSAGDNIVCFGDYINIGTSHLVVIETVGDDAPAFKEFYGVGYTDGTAPDFSQNSLDSKLKTRISPPTGSRFISKEFIIETPSGNVNLKVAMDGISTRVEQMEEDTYIIKEVDIDADDLLSKTFYLPQGDYELYIKSISHFNDDYAYIDLVKTGTRKNIAYIESDYEDYIGNFTIAVKEAGYYSIDVRDDEYSTHGTISEIFIKTRVASYSEFKQTSDSIVASVKNVERSNIFVGIADGTGWAYGYFDADNISFRTKTAVTQGEAQILTITSPVSKLLAKGKYVISFYAAAHGTSKDYTLDIQDDSQTPVTLFSATTADGTLIEITDDFATASNLKRYYFVFELSTAKKIKVIFSQSAVGMFVLTDATYYRPLLQTGEYPTEFSFGQVTSEAYMKMTADGISARVDNNAGEIARVDIKADGITSQVNAIKAGKNLLTGVLTGNGWKSASSVGGTLNDVTVDTYGYITAATGDSYIVSPNVNVQAGKKYTLSFYWNSGGAFDIAIRGTNTHIDDSKSGGGDISYTFTATNTERVNIYVQLSSIRYPQLELGEVATAFESGDSEMSSEIKQTADQIILRAGQAGLKINGDNRQIDLIAGKVNFVDPNGDPYETPKIRIDSTYGTLTAVGMTAQGGTFNSITVVNGTFSGLLENKSTDERNIVSIKNDATINIKSAMLDENGDVVYDDGEIVYFNSVLVKSQQETIERWNYQTGQFDIVGYAFTGIIELKSNYEEQYGNQAYNTSLILNPNKTVFSGFFNVYDNAPKSNGQGKNAKQYLNIQANQIELGRESYGSTTLDWNKYTSISDEEISVAWTTGFEDEYTEGESHQNSIGFSIRNDYHKEQFNGNNLNYWYKYLEVYKGDIYIYSEYREDVEVGANEYYFGKLYGGIEIRRHPNTGVGGLAIGANYFRGTSSSDQSAIFTDTAKFGSIIPHGTIMILCDYFNVTLNGHYAYDSTSGQTLSSITSTNIGTKHIWVFDSNFVLNNVTGNWIIISKS